jgi:hypothetical protein
MTNTINITCPDGKSGLAVEPWSRGEIYAVSANWAQASDPVRVYGPDGWTYDEHGRQVADFRHAPADALRAQIEDAIVASGGYDSDDPEEQEAEVQAIMDLAVEIND